MNEFIKSIFTTPVNLWTLPQILFVAGVIFIIAMFGIFVWWFADFLKERIKYKGCSIRKASKNLCNGDCKKCNFRRSDERNIK